ncbi:MAG: polyprenol monophosphomannose synthase [Candidatus Saganbacteria bacterium]|nr:polyprenol monophosphomannose synthase [Candidatus Saganbacteria bacterium]
MLSIIVPTYNERKNLKELCERIFKVVPNDTELIIVDDNSEDGTIELAKHLSQKSNITILSRPGRMGLSSAVIDGFKIAKGNILAVMDADLQHPPEALPKMLARIQGKKADFVIGSRLVKGGGSKDWPWYRKIISLVARIPAMPLTKIKDLTSGLFMLKKEVIDGVKLNPIGFKICLEIICKGNYKNIEEFPIMFGERRGGKSKLGNRQIFEYLVQLKELYRNRS